jgi:hypothetical protein
MKKEKLVDEIQKLRAALMEIEVVANDQLSDCTDVDTLFSHGQLLRSSAGALQAISDTTSDALVAFETNLNELA